jgi:hypothetical protein
VQITTEVKSGNLVAEAERAHAGLEAALGLHESARANVSAALRVFRVRADELRHARHRLEAALAALANEEAAA